MELNIKRRKAYYLCNIYKKYVIELGLDKEVLRDLQWSKAKELLSVITPENWSDLVSKMKTMSVAQIQEMVREMSGKTKKESADTDKEEMKSITFRLTQEQMENWNNAFEIAKSMTSSDKPGNCLDLICMEFVAGAAGTGVDAAITSLEKVIKNVERAYGVTLDIKEVDTERYKGEEKPAEATA